MGSRVPGHAAALTEDVEGEGDAGQTEAFKEAHGAEHGHVDGERHGQSEHQHEEHRDDQHRMAAKPDGQGEEEEEGVDVTKQLSFWDFLVPSHKTKGTNERLPLIKGSVKC